MKSEDALLESLFHAAVAAAQPEKTIGRYLPEKPKGRTVVVGAGKGSAQLARALEDQWDGPLSGTVVTRYGYACDCKHITVLEASHPVPDEAGMKGAEKLFETVNGLSEDDLVIALICGGGSSLLPAPPPGVTLADEKALNEALLGSGAPIDEMNCIRKHVSMIKGGRLALAAHPARVVSLIVSDIPGDVAAHVASGPTVASHNTLEHARALVRRYALALPASIHTHLMSDAVTAPSPEDPRFAGHEVHIIASAQISLEAAAWEARNRGFEAVILSDAIEGEAREIAHMHAAMARQISLRGQPFATPVILLSGGETTVTLRHNGRGGRNTEFLLSLALDMDGMPGIHALAADTDGIDGSEDNAGAFADGHTATAIREAGADPAELLAKNDAWGAFDLAGTLFVPGPTGTNVNDFRAILIR
ncbi:MAG: glycerate kinase [Alphaproteobacteria bacterium]|nr:glycerate kinase [Alphaproteobacteria bacterium]